MSNSISNQHVLSKAKSMFFYQLVLCLALLFLSVSLKAEGTTKNADSYESVEMEKAETNKQEQVIIAVNTAMIQSYLDYMTNHSAEVLTWRDFSGKAYHEMVNRVETYNSNTLRPVIRY
ncbi:MAG: hypothetical protein GVY19_02960 [Bacteroidetes bacterium]|jgi:hypothetical protein|nr:hypothetical protein [Bacteroidota bacterium]